MRSVLISKWCCRVGKRRILSFSIWITWWQSGELRLAVFPSMSSTRRLMLFNWEGAKGYNWRKYEQNKALVINLSTESRHKCTKDCGRECWSNRTTEDLGIDGAVLLKHPKETVSYGVNWILWNRRVSIEWLFEEGNNDSGSVRCE